MSFLEDCRKLIGLESTPGHGNLSCAEFAARLCEQAGLRVELQRETVAGVDQCNILARPQDGGPKEGELLLQTHLDTVPAGHFSHWTKTQSNPFNASIYNDVMYGLGAADAKLDFLCKLEAIRKVGGRPVKAPFVLAGTFGGARPAMAGAIRLIRKKMVNASRALIGEPTDMRAVHAGAGIAVVEISIPFSDEERVYRRDHDLKEVTSSQSRMFLGRAAHSSDPKAGDNAIMKMLEYLSHLPEGIAVMDLNGGVNDNSVPADALLEVDLVAGFKDPILPKISKIYASLLKLEQDLAAFTEDGLWPAHPTMNIGTIRTNEAEVRMSGSCRLPPSVTDDVYERWMRKLESAVLEVGATFCVKDYKRGFSASPETSFIKGVQEVLSGMGLNPELKKMSFASEANVFSRLGIECLVWGPGQSVGNSHAPNENIKISDLHAAVDFYARVLERFCL